jgi:hypothetical protein
MADHRVRGRRLEAGEQRSHDGQEDDDRSAMAERMHFEAYL